MAKSASALAFALLVATIGSASATDFPPECLRQIDDLIVEYDLPASAAFAGTQTEGNQTPLPGIPKQGGLPAADLPHTPAGRGAPGTPRRRVAVDAAAGAAAPAGKARGGPGGAARCARGGRGQRQCEVLRRRAPGAGAHREEGLRREGRLHVSRSECDVAHRPSRQNPAWS